jgi:protein required for attachment to host cells
LVENDGKRRPTFRNVAHEVHGWSSRPSGINADKEGRMKPWYVVVADKGRARFISLEWPEDPDVEGGPKLSELSELVNAEAKLKDTELFTGKTGRNNTTNGHWGAGFDDHRDRQRAQNNERFAKQIADVIEKRVRELRPPRVVLAAEPQMLGHLRGKLNAALFHDIELTELSQDLSGQSLSQIHKVLVQRQLAPPHHPPREGFHYPPGSAPPGSARS